MDPRKDYVVQMEVTEAKEEARRENIDKFKSWLETQHEEALNENPFSRCVSRVPVEWLGALTPQEREQVDAFEEQVHGRLQPLAQDKAEQRSAFLAAGGTPEAFERNWSEYGRDLAVQTRAAEIEAARHVDDIF